LNVIALAQNKQVAHASVSFAGASASLAVVTEIFISAGLGVSLPQNLVLQNLITLSFDKEEAASKPSPSFVKTKLSS